MADEQVIRDGKPAFLEVWPSQNGLLSFLLFGWNIGLLRAWLATKQWRLTITDQRVDFVQGILSTKQESVEFYRARDSNYTQTLLQKIFGVGNVWVVSADATAPVVTFPIRNPSGMRDQIRNFIRDQRKEMGTAMRD